MAEEKEKSQRRVYGLPPELVERIVQYQKEMGLPSEVEAARRLLDAALMYRDDWKAVVDRFLEKRADSHVLGDAVKAVLVDHPLVKSIDFGEQSIAFKMKEGIDVRIWKSGKYEATIGKDLISDREHSPWPDKWPEDIPF